MWSLWLVKIALSYSRVRDRYGSLFLREANIFDYVCEEKPPTHRLMSRRVEIWCSFLLWKVTTLWLTRACSSNEPWGDSMASHWRHKCECISQSIGFSARHQSHDSESGLLEVMWNTQGVSKLFIAESSKLLKISASFSLGCNIQRSAVPLPSSLKPWKAQEINLSDTRLWDWA